MAENREPRDGADRNYLSVDKKNRFYLRYVICSVIMILILSACSSLPKGVEPVTAKYEAAAQSYELGENQLHQGLYPAAIGNFEAALNQFAVLDERRGVIKAFLAIGRTAVTMGDYDRALRCYEWALPLAENLDDSVLLLDTANHLGNCYLALGDLDGAEEWSLYSSVPEESSEVQAEHYRLKGTISKRKGDYGKALEFYEKALIIDRDIPDSVQIGTNHYLMGSAYSLMEDYANAEISLLTALEKDRFYELLPGIAADLLALGLVMEHDGRTEDALLYYDRAFLAWKGLGNEDRMEELSRRVADIRGEPLIFP